MEDKDGKLFQTQEDELFKAGHAGVPLWLKLLWLFFVVWIIVYLSQNL